MTAPTGSPEDRSPISEALTGADALPRISWVATTTFVATSLTAVFFESVRPVATAVALTLFVLGSAAFLGAFAIAVGRSRTEAIGIGGLYFLAGDTAPVAVRRSMMASVGVQTAVALATATARPFTSLAFGILVPVFGLAVAGLWGARHGRFDLRREG